VGAGGENRQGEERQEVKGKRNGEKGMEGKRDLWKFRKGKKMEVVGEKIEKGA